MYWYIVSGEMPTVANIIVEKLGKEKKGLAVKQVSRYNTRGESQGMLESLSKSEARSCFDSQRGRHKKSKTGIPKRSYIRQIIFLIK